MENTIVEELSLSEKLRIVLDNMTQEEFDQQWDEIKALKLEGPLMSDVVEFFNHNNVKYE